MPLDVSVIIVNWNTRELLEKAIVSVRRHCGALSTETIVVDNASTDGSAERVASLYSNCHLIANTENLGYTRACNQGLAVSHGRYVLFLNPDAELTTNCLETLVATMDRTPDIGACSPRLTEDPTVVPGGVFPRLWLRLLPVQTNWRIENRMIADFYHPGEMYDCEWLVGACLLVRRTTIEQVGPMEERLFMWYDDAEWCWRMRRKGWRRVVIPDAYCIHQHGASASQVPSFQADVRMTMAEYSYWRLRRGRLPTLVLWASRSLRLALKTALQGMRRIQPAAGTEAALTAPRLRWHLRHAADILWREPRPYRGDDVASERGASTNTKA